MWVKPSAKDKRLAALRMQALADGLHVQSCQIQDLSIDGRLNKLSRSAFSYRRYTKRDTGHSLLLLRTSGESGIYLPDSWVWGTGQRLEEAQAQSLTSLLQQLPESIMGIELTHDYVGVIWDEYNPDEYPQVKQLLLSDIPY
ncbi:hypothetical protein [Gynuella sunshinyii]|uniref:Uncharacterized protein n=1 Tax=Gynuella sunshinyii YC6258 TaxID=1445510 RepID=A0A0C5VY99_9GAMM|nr:hypothetical protein [Gynuella sunshinyii]AJQ95359.1 hypothetical Protein YC6258_03323 [Gynuella sunshinyii YC6258]